MILLVQGSARTENGEKLEFDDPLKRFGLFSRSEGLQNEAEMDPKTIKRREERRERRKKGRESTKKSSLKAPGSR